MTLALLITILRIVILGAAWVLVGIGMLWLLGLWH